MQGWGKGRLDEMIVEAVVDCDTDDEAITGFLTMIETCLELPFASRRRTEESWPSVPQGERGSGSVCSIFLYRCHRRGEPSGSWRIGTGRRGERLLHVHSQCDECQTRNRCFDLTFCPSWETETETWATKGRCSCLGSRSRRNTQSRRWDGVRDPNSYLCIL
jgi:hypothetical protein